MLDQLLDLMWLKIELAFGLLGRGLFFCTSLLHPLGPAMTITFLALVTVLITKLLNRIIITRRFITLEKEFLYWQDIRNRAAALDGQTKGQRMARNIDQAKLDRIYYDYFLEGLLLGLARKAMPIILFAGFISKFYNPQQLTMIFGQPQVLSLPARPPILIGGLFWYILTLLCTYILWWSYPMLRGRF